MALPSARGAPKSMRALAVTPGKPDSVRLEERPMPAPDRGDVLVRTLLLGVCGTDREIISGQYGESPPGTERLVIGHESLGRVESAPDGSGLAAGDLVVGIVRLPDPVPCASCAVGEWDMCRNGRYTEHGIKAVDGFGAEWFRVNPEFAVKIDEPLGMLGVLIEPASVVAKAWDHTERIGRRAHWEPRRVLVTGAGPVGLLAALLAAQRGMEIHVLDRVTEGIKPSLVHDLGATYHTGSLNDGSLEFDVVMECTGAPDVVQAVVGRTAPNGIVCLAGVSEPGSPRTEDVGAFNHDMVLGNRVVFGTVNANRRHYELARGALAAADRDWLARLITRRVPLARWTEAFELRHDDVKTVIEFSDA